MINFQAERLRRLPQRPGEIWQGGITRLPLWVQADEEGLPDPVRSWAAGWVSLQTRAVFLSDGYTETSGQAEALLDALVDLAYDEKQAGYRPGKVQVCEPLLAECLIKAARLEEAADHLRELLRLNPDDILGARFWLWPCLLRLGKDAEVEKLLKQSKRDKGDCTWVYTRALLTFRQKGETPLARRHLNQAIKNNPICAEYLMHGKGFPKPTSDGRELFYDDDGCYCADVLAAAWHETAGAAEWLDERIGWSAEPDWEEEEDGE